MFSRIDRLEATDGLIACPACKGLKPKRSIMPLHTYVKRQGRYLAIRDGERVACQECPCVFSISYSEGVFQHDHRSLPLTQEVQIQSASERKPTGKVFGPIEPRERMSGV